MNRTDLQKIAEMRLEDARVLMENGHYAGAYYLCGYVVECALKACIARKIREHEFPDKKTVNDSYTHDLTRLLHLAGLDETKFDDSQLDLNWSLVKDWSEESRYRIDTRKEAAVDMFSSTVDPDTGVLQWIKRYW